MKKIGLVINPIAGMGGSVGLKGTDHAVEEALRRGAVPGSEMRTMCALTELLEYKDQIEILTGFGPLGEKAAASMGFRTRVVWSSTGTQETDAMDTVCLAKSIVSEHADLLLFAGGDGTARDLYRAVGTGPVCVGIPAGVKIHSPVYAKSPEAAGKLAALWVQGSVSKTVEEEVLDIDEEAYRREQIHTSLYGYLTIPKESRLTQNRKAPTPLSDVASIESIAHEIVEQMEPGCVYLIGAGTTPRGIMELLGLPNTLIGVDLVRDGKLIAKDAYGEQILTHIRGQKAKLVLTITGGQGFLFGRGNQQLTPEIIRAVGTENLILLATRSKLARLSGAPLLVDTADRALNRELCGYRRVVTGYREYTVCRVAEP